MVRHFTALCMMIAALMLAIVSSAQAGHSSSRSWASWYGPGLYGNNMACGGRLTTATWGVAHKWLPCGTRIRICYMRCVYARVIDRGPYVGGRDFDLTYPVKRAIGMPSVGLVRWYITGH